MIAFLYIILRHGLARSILLMPSKYSSEVLCSLFVALSELTICLMGSNDHILSGIMGNLMGLITELYRVMFGRIMDNSAEKEEVSTYVNHFKAISTKLLSKPWLFKYYMQNISLNNCLWFLYRSCYTICSLNQIVI